LALPTVCNPLKLHITYHSVDEGFKRLVTLRNKEQISMDAT